LQRLTIGGICSYKTARQLMENKLGLQNSVSLHINGESKSQDGRFRYSSLLRKEIYTCIVKTAKKARPELEIALCLEENELWHNSGLSDNLYRCNCIL